MSDGLALILIFFSAPAADGHGARDVVTAVAARIRDVAGELAAIRIANQRFREGD